MTPADAGDSLKPPIEETTMTQMMPRPGSVRFPPRPGTAGRPSPRPTSGARPQGAAPRFTSRPSMGRTQPRPTGRGSRPSGPAGGAFGRSPGRGGPGFVNPRGKGASFSPRWSRGR